MDKNRMKRQMRRYRRPGAMMRMGRIVVSLLMLVMVTVVATGLGGTLALKLGWVTRIQVFPLAVAGSVTGLVSWLLVTVLFGRLYCSWVCPLGTVQDCAARLTRTGAKRRRHTYSFAEPANVLRYTVLGVVVVCMITGMAVLPALLDPMSAYGRIASELLRPVLGIAFESGSAKGIAPASGWAALIAAVTLVVVGLCAIRSGRLWCNTICPVGSFLSIFSRYSFYHIDIDTDVCTNCHSCERACKAQCINVSEHQVDGSRCVMCFDCLDACPEGAIRYTYRRKRLSWPLMQKVAGTAASAMDSRKTPRPLNEAADKTVDKATDNAGDDRVRISRRQFMATGLLVAAMPVIGKLTGDNERHPAPAAPPGRLSMSDFLQRCTACGVCVANCPTGVLRPSLNEFGWTHTMQPVMDFGRGYCEYNCTRCTEVCPPRVLEPLTTEEKHIYIIGKAQVDAELCVGCGRCAWSCPRQVIAMEKRPGRERPVAVVNEALCIGCGKCQNVCPVKPLTAIYVEGVR